VGCDSLRRSLGLARTGDKHEFIRTAKDMLNTLDSISEYSATAGLVHVCGATTLNEEKKCFGDYIFIIF
jgi:hypothetical protein